MGHTNQTANYNLPQFVGTDKPSWLGDINDAFAAIDTAIAAAASEASTADGKADALTTTVSGHTTQIGTLQNTVTTQGNTLNTVTSLIGNGTPTTTDQTIIGAINELNAKEGNLSDLTTTDKSSLVAAINEAAQGGGGVTGSVSVTADGVKTIATLLSELYSAIDSSKVNVKSVLDIDGDVLQYGGSRTGLFIFQAALINYNNTSAAIKRVEVGTTGKFYQGSDNGSAMSFTDQDSIVLTSGKTITLYY